MRTRALWLRLRNTPVLRMLQLEEALFRNDTRSWFITNTWDAPPEARGAAAAGSGGAGLGRPAAAAAHDAAAAIVLGISGKPAEMLDTQAVGAAAVPVIRRFSGGGTVVCDADTLFASFICAAEAEPAVGPYPEPILAWSADVYDAALQRCGVSNFAVRANDYCLATAEGDLKFGGNAQSISGKRWLHHTSLLWRFDPDRMGLLRMPARQPEYRASRPHGSFIRGLAAAGLPCREAFGEALAAAVAERWELEPVDIGEAEAALALPHRQVTRLLTPEEVR